MTMVLQNTELVRLILSGIRCYQRVKMARLVCKLWRDNHFGTPGGPVVVFLSELCCRSRASPRHECRFPTVGGIRLRFKLPPRLRMNFMLSAWLQHALLINRFHKVFKSDTYHGWTQDEGFALTRTAVMEKEIYSAVDTMVASGFVPSADALSMILSKAKNKLLRVDRAPFMTQKVSSLLSIMLGKVRASDRSLVGYFVLRCGSICNLPWAANLGRAMLRSNVVGDAEAGCSILAEVIGAGLDVSLKKCDSLVRFAAEGHSHRLKALQILARVHVVPEALATESTIEFILDNLGGFNLDTVSEFVAALLKKNDDLVPFFEGKFEGSTHSRRITFCMAVAVQARIPVKDDYFTKAMDRLKGLSHPVHTDELCILTTVLAFAMERMEFFEDNGGDKLLLTLAQMGCVRKRHTRYFETLRDRSAVCKESAMICLAAPSV